MSYTLCKVAVLTLFLVKLCAETYISPEDGVPTARSIALDPALFRCTMSTSNSPFEATNNATTRRSSGFHMDYYADITINRNINNPAFNALSPSPPLDGVLLVYNMPPAYFIDPAELQDSTKLFPDIRVVVMDDNANPELMAAEASSSVFAVELNNISYDVEKFQWRLRHQFPVRLRYHNVVESSIGIAFGAVDQVSSLLTTSLDAVTNACSTGAHCSVPIPHPIVIVKSNDSFNRAIIRELSEMRTTKSFEFEDLHEFEDATKTHLDDAVVTVSVPVGSMEWLPLVLPTTIVVQAVLGFGVLHYLIN